MNALEDGTAVRLDFGKVQSAAKSPERLLPVVLQHAETHDVLFVGYTRGITALAETGESETVRDWAAAHALFWDAERVRPLLESVAQEETLRGLDAKTVLREFDAGRLTMEWVPKGGSR